MIKGHATIKATGPGLLQIRQATAYLDDTDVLVGVPEANAPRTGEINNAQLTYIQTHGVRSKGMAAEMDQTMLNAEGVPHTLDYDRFLTNMGRGIPYSQALAMYIQSHGSPAWRIPPRPIIEPAIEDPENKDAIEFQMRAAARAALDGSLSNAQTQLKLVGEVAQDAVFMWFENPKNRWARLSTKTVRAKGSDAPLVDTGKLRRAITYVVRSKGAQA